jgi:Protochlamydia outer membrane protein
MFSAAFIDTVIINPYSIYEQSELVWNIASSPDENTTPNILSELSYTDLISVGGGLQVEIIHKLNENWALLVRANANKTWLQSGEFQDSDYFFDNRQGEFSRSYGDTDDDGGKQWSFALGLKTRWANQPGHYVSILTGYSEQSLDLLMTHGVQHIPAQYRGERFDDLSSTYDTEYKYWFIEADTEHVFPWGILGMQYQYLDVDMSSEANWNLRDDFAHPRSYTHKGDGDGYTITLGYTLPITNALDISLSYQYRKIKIKDGYDRTFFSDGGSSATRLNESTFKSNVLKFELNIIF